MARFTMTINEIKELYNIFDFEYTTPFGVTAEQLQEAFFVRYDNREIGYETYEMWKPKFEFLWKQALQKYDVLFNHTIDVFNSFKSTTSGTQSSGSTNTNTMKHLPTPVTNVVSGSEIPASFTTGAGESNSDVEQETTTTRQTKNDVELMKQYREAHETTLEWFLRELNKVMLKRY